MPDDDRLVAMSDGPKIIYSMLGVSKTIDKRTIIKDISLSYFYGAKIGVLGLNGAGKSTLARLVLGLVQPDNGNGSGGTVSRRKGLRVGYMPQHIKIDDSLPLTVDRFLWLAAPGPTASRRAALERAGVAHLRRRGVQQLSGGEMQRVLLARALLRKPDLLVLDEPAQGVDVAGQNALYGLLKTVRDELGCAILLISHDLHLVMAATDEVICLQRHVCCSGSPESVSRDPAYHELFGPGAGTPNLALYTHDHDHDHDLHGNATHSHEHSHHHDHDGPCNHD